MAITLHATFVSSCQQMLGSVIALLDKAEAFCSANGNPPEDIIQARLADDMFPFAYQAKSTAVHSIGAIEGVRRGVFSPDTTKPPETFDALRTVVNSAIEKLAAVDPRELDGFEGQAMRFEFGDYRLDFKAENFLLSFSLPNFYFHTSMVYAILRLKGVPIGKGDFMGGCARNARRQTLPTLP